MRRLHFEALRPRCPVCRGAERESLLEIATVVAEEGDAVLEGVLRCTEVACLREYPVIDGIPLIIGPIRDYVSSNIGQIQAREDLSATLESVLGDCCGPGSPLDASRQQLSSYAFDHYGDLDPAEPTEAGAGPGSVVRLLDGGLALAGEPAAGPVIDLGCSVGRTTFELAARVDGPVLGIDLNFAMLRTASRVLHRGTVSYPRRRVGLVYDRRELTARMPAADRVDFWACDVVALPFADECFELVAGLNVLDCVASPAGVLEELTRVLSPGGRAVLASPYDWSPSATQVEAWIGGHSQRGEGAGASEPALRRLLASVGGGEGGLRILAEETSVPWRVRLHERSVVEYSVHLLAAEKAAETDG